MKLLKKIAFGAFPLVVIVGLIESYRSADFVEKLLGIPSDILMLLTFVAFVAMRFRNIEVFHEKRATGVFLAGFVAILISSFLSVIGYFNGANFIYSITSIHLDKFFLVSLFVFSVGILSLPNTIFKSLHRPIFFFVSITYLFFFFFYSLLPFHVIYELVKENQLVEYMQFFVLLLSGIFSILIFNKIKRGKKITAYLFLGIGILLLFVAGDEIAWGQYLFGLTPPETILIANTQKELTLHNLKNVSGFIPFIYIVIGFYGSLSWFVINNKIFSPDKYLAPFFLVPGLYNIVASLNTHSIGVFSEPAELFLYCGVLFHLLTLFYITLHKNAS